MELKDFLDYENIVIQCHDNPDADALASGYALMWYFQQNKKKARFIYRGRNEIKKSNLLIMIKELEVPVEYEPFFAEEPDLVILVDCQFGQKNVSSTNAATIAVIDHHHKVSSLPENLKSMKEMTTRKAIVRDFQMTTGFLRLRSIMVFSRIQTGCLRCHTRWTAI